MSFQQSLSAADPTDSAADGVEDLIGMQKEGIGGAEGGRRSYGQISVVGRRREMHDAVAVKLGFMKRGRESYDFFGVFDGRRGRRVVRACSQMLHHVLAVIAEEESTEEIDWEEVMVEGFHDVEAKMNESGGTAALVGTAAVVGDNEVVVAGTKAVLSRGGAAVRLLDGGKSKGGEREVRVERRSRADEFLILGSDGFWDFMSDEVACQIGRRFCSRGGDDDDGSGGAEAAAALMAEMAVAHGSKDNVSVILVDLRTAYDSIPTSPVSNGV